MMIWKQVRFLPALLVMAVLVLGIVACGNSAERSGSGGTKPGGFSSDVVAQGIAVAADPNGLLKWDKDVYNVSAGDITFVVSNQSSVDHDFAVKGNGINASSKPFKNAASQNLTLKGLPAGEYQIACTLVGHEMMVAKLTVR